MKKIIFTSLFMVALSPLYLKAQNRSADSTSQKIKELEKEIRAQEKKIEEQAKLFELQVKQQQLKSVEEALKYMHGQRDDSADKKRKTSDSAYYNLNWTMPGKDSVIIKKIVVDTSLKLPWLDTLYTSHLGPEVNKDIMKLNLHLPELNEQLRALNQKLSDMNDTLDEDIRDDLADNLKDINSDIKLTNENLIYIVKTGKDTEGHKPTVQIGDKKLTIHYGNGKKNKPGYKASEFNFLGFDLGLNTYMYDPVYRALSNDMQHNLALDQVKSVNATLHLVTQGINFYHDKLYLTYGISIDYHDFRFANKTTLQPHTDSFKVVNQSYPVDKSKLSVQYLTLPVMLHFETNPLHSKRSFQIGVGGYAGLRIKSYTKQVSGQGGKVHIYEDFNLSPYDYGVSATIGYGHFQLYANYPLTPLFNSSSAAPELHPLTVGVVLNGFRWD